MTPVEPRNITPAKRLNRTTQAGSVLRTGKKMDRVVHEYVSMDRHAVIAHDVEQDFQIAAAIRVVAEHGLPVVTSLNDEVWQPRNDEAGQTRHQPGNPRL